MRKLPPDIRKANRLASKKAWKLRNHEAVLKKNREYRAKNKQAISEQCRKRYSENPELFNLRNKISRDKNLETRKRQEREFAARSRAENPEKYKEYKRLWRLKNRETVRQKERAIYAKNKKEVLDKKRQYRLNTIDASRARGRRSAARRREQIRFRIEGSLRGRIHAAVRRGFKSARTLDLLGCNLDFYKDYLQQMFKNGMAWNNYGSVWEIDHIIPCSSFDLTRPEQQRRCFHYANTQPLLVFHNRSKNSRIVNQQFNLI